MKRDFICIRDKFRRLIQAREINYDGEKDIYSACSIQHLLNDQDTEDALECLKRTALYMDLPHPHGRDVRGENDFAATRLIVAINELYDKMTDDVKAHIKRFFLERDFTSMYGSENHVFMMRVARFLAAEFYGEDFKQFGITSDEAIRRDKKYIIEFVQFRAKYGLGEFTSAYLAEDMYMCSLLKEYAKDEEVKSIAQLAVDLITVEALHNLDKNGCLAGAVGRTYSFFPAFTHVMEGIKRVYVDGKVEGISQVRGLVTHAPDDFILDSFITRTYPDEVREEKHLHSMYAWRSDTPDWAHIEKLFKAGRISKYTYLGEKYGIGAINRQDAYPVDETEDWVYAHHQQVEWSLAIPGESEGDATKIFSSHPGVTGEHRHWTGDNKCCCSNTYANKNTAMVIYDIEQADQLEYTHMFIETEKYDRIERFENRIFLKKGDVNVFIYVNNPFEIDFKEHELKSQGRKNAYICRVEADTEFDEFIKKYKEMPVLFDQERMHLEFDGLFLDKNGNGSVDSPEKYPYGYVYDSSWVKAKWGEGIVNIKGGDKTLVLDFVNNRKYIK